MVGQIIVEPKGSTYHDPHDGRRDPTPARSPTSTQPDNRDSLPGVVNGSFREFALWTIDQMPGVDSTLNLRAEPWADRPGTRDPSLLFTSYTHGDPYTPLPQAYPGDPFVIRTITANASVDTLHVDGMRFYNENRLRSDHRGRASSPPINTFH